MAAHLSAHSRDLGGIIRLETHAFAAKIRLARAVLGWSQTELGRRVGLTQRAIHKLEQGETEPRRATVRSLEEIWREQSIEFEDLADGGFRASIRSSVLERPAPTRSPRKRARPGASG
jgi:transcriptional regulator with XRE-family HTH domain